METLNNLVKAFVGESQARNRYEFYSKIARKEGFESIGNVFALTADNEKEHAKRIFEHIQELKEKDEVKLEIEAPLVYGNTQENLKAAIKGENYEYTQMYPEFSKKAEEDGLSDVALRLKAIAKAEEHHEERFKKILEQLEKGTFFKKEEEVEWVCLECGYVHLGIEPPEKCPSCDHQRSYYELKCEEY